MLPPFNHFALRMLALLAPFAVLASSFSSTQAAPYVWVGSWGTHGSGPGQLCNPADVEAAGAQFIYVADGCNARIQKFTPSGGYVTEWPVSTGDMAIGPDGSLVVPNTNAHKIQRYDANGAFLGEWGVLGSGDDQLFYPTDVAVASNGDVYVTGPFNPRVRKFTIDGTFLLAWGAVGSGPGQFGSEPGATAVDHMDNVWVADAGNGRVQKFAPDGAFLMSIGSLGSGDGQFAANAISDLAVDLADNLFVAEGAFVDRIQQFDSQGTFLTKFGGEPGPGDLLVPSGVAVDENGVVYVTDLNERVTKFADMATPTLRSTWGRIKVSYR
jgi:streptogramin lyase